MINDFLFYFLTVLVLVLMPPLISAFVLNIFRKREENSPGIVLSMVMYQNINWGIFLAIIVLILAFFQLADIYNYEINNIQTFFIGLCMVTSFIILLTVNRRKIVRLSQKTEKEIPGPIGKFFRFSFGVSDNSFLSILKLSFFYVLIMVIIVLAIVLIFG